MTQVQFQQPDNGKHGGDPNIPRDGRGRPLIQPPGGGKPVAYTRATTFISALGDTTHLTNWKLRLAVHGLASRPDLIERAQQAEGDKKLLNQIATDALDHAGQYDKAKLGTRIHEATEAYDRGDPVPDLGEYKPDLDAYATAMLPFKIIEVEQFRVVDELQVGGTCDRVVEHNGQRYIADIKTGSLYDPGAFAQQLAVYSRGIPYDYATGQRTPDEKPVSTTHGLLIHLPAGEGTCSLFWLNLDTGWQAVQLSHQVRQYRQYISRKATREQVIIPATFT